MSSPEFVRRLFGSVMPFRFLPAPLLDKIAPDVELRHFTADEIIIRQGDTSDRSVYVLDEGYVEVRDPEHGDRVLEQIGPGHYFGEWEPLFKVPRLFEIRAMQEAQIAVLTGDTFLSLLRGSRAFAQALGTVLREKQGVFQAFDHFDAELKRAVAQGYINITRITPLYRALNPAIHRGAADDRYIDFGALMYAVRRLPQNVTHTFGYLLVDELPQAYTPPEHFFRVIHTTARRRDVWEMLPGKSMVLLRSGLSDLLDLVSCLCLYAVEARKIRKRLQEQQYLMKIQDYLAVANVDSAGTHQDQYGLEALFRALPFDAKEARMLREVWPVDTVTRLSEIVFHREMFTVDVRRKKRSYNTQRTEIWTSQIAAATRSLLGCEPGSLAADRPVHIVSSNTHSVVNCLTPWHVSHQAEVLDWARQARPELIDHDWDSPSDCFYAVLRDYLAEHPEAKQAIKRDEEAHGIAGLTETASTGIQVQLIDLSKLAGADIDPDLPPFVEERNDLIVNIDYAFGEQAQYIINNLLLLFGANLASVSFLGKAGALQGQRGDILLPTAFIEQGSDIFEPLPDYPSDRLKKRFAKRGVLSGPMLTVRGTLLQSREMLQFYREIWGCIGLEMEGAHYYRRIVEAAELGVISQNVRMRSFYYVSDLPEESKTSLSAPLRAWEGVPPLYGITREVLHDIITGPHTL
ncbi:MAG: cyclic nucleotide-binding domain-containing protein [Spirochaetia bacterium]